MLMILGEPIKRWRCVYRTCEARCCRLRRELTLADIRRITEKTGLPSEKFVKITANQTVPFTLKRRGGQVHLSRGELQMPTPRSKRQAYPLPDLPPPPPKGDLWRRTNL